MIYTVQAWRGLAVVLVVLFHGSGMVSARYGVEPLGGVFRYGFSGVHLFFVLSGFIILSAHARDIGRPGRVFYYLGRRIIRIYPLYLLIFMIWGGWRLFVGKMPPAEFFSNAILFSSHSKLVIPVSWTLAYEIIFYLLFCGLILSRWIGFAVILAWAVAVVLNDGQAGYHALHRFNLLFIFGLLAGLGFFQARKLPRNIRNALSDASLALGALTFAGTAYYYSTLNLGPSDWPEHPLTILGFGLASALLLLAAASDRVEGFFARFGLAGLLGNASYSIYLVHLQFERMALDATKPIAWIWSGAKDRLTSNLLLALVAITAVALGIAVHLKVERPLLAFLRSRLPKASAG
jgi:peptidoglycan/LPS O-acetylase OafA/YrhL